MVLLHIQFSDILKEKYVSGMIFLYDGLAMYGNFPVSVPI